MTPREQIEKFGGRLRKRIAGHSLTFRRQEQRCGCSIDVLLVATLFLEVGDEGDSLVDRSRAVRGDQIR